MTNKNKYLINGCPCPPEDKIAVAGQVIERDGSCFMQFLVDGVICGEAPLDPLFEKIVFPEDIDPELDVAVDYANCLLTITYDDQEYPVSLLPYLQQVGIAYEPGSHQLTHTIKGAEQYRVELNCGELDVDLVNCVARYTNEKGQVTERPIPAATMTCEVQPDGSRIYCFDNGTLGNKPGSKKFIQIPAVQMDIDNATLVDDILTLTFGGDGNPGQLIVPLCEIIATHCNATIVSFDATGFTHIDNAGEEHFVPFPVNCCTYHLIGQTYNPDGPNNPPGVKIANAEDGDTLTVKYPENADGIAALGFYTCDNGTWVEDFICPIGVPQALPTVKSGSSNVTVDVTTGPDNEPCYAVVVDIPDETPPEVFIGTARPSKTDGYVVWFNPVTCVVRFCDDAGNWLEPRNVVCQATAPECAKGEADIWFNTVEGCLYVCCDGVWISSDAQAVRSVINAMCMRVGNGPVEDLPVVDGKVVIPIPSPTELPRYCLQIGDGNEIFGQETSEGKLRFNLPAYPEFFETCLRIGDQLVVPHLEDGKYYLDFEFPEIPEIPEHTPSTLVDNGNGSFTHDNGEDPPVTVTFCPVCPVVTGAGDIVASSSTGANGETIYTVEYNHTPSTLVDNNNGSFTHDNGVDEPVTVEFCPVCPEVVGAGDISVTSSIGEEGQVVYTVSYSETVTGLEVDAAAGTFTYTNEAGDPVTVDVCELVQGCLPTVSAGSSNVTVTPTPDPTTGVIDYVVSVGEQEIPPLPIFCVQDKAGNRINATIEEGKVILDLPPVLACQTDQPATDGSAGCIWYDDNCLHVLCNGVWVSPDASAIAG